VPAPAPSCSRRTFWRAGSKGELHEEDAAAMLITLQHDCKHHRHLDASRTISALLFTVVCVVNPTTQGYEATGIVTCNSKTNESCSFPGEDSCPLGLQPLVWVKALSVTVISLHS